MGGDAAAARELVQAQSLAEGKAALGLWALLAGRVEAARPLLAQAAAQSPENDEIAYWRGLVELTAGYPGTAARELERAASVAPQRFEVLLALASARAALGAPAVGEPALRAAEIEPNLLVPRYLPDPRRGLARVVRSAFRDLRSRGELHLMAGRLLFEVNLFDEAYDELQQASRVHGAPPLVDALLGRLALERGEFAEAERLLRGAAAAPRAGSEVVLDLALALKQLGRRDDALAVLAGAADGHPNDPRALTASAGAALERNDLPRAEELFQYAVRRDPNLVAARVGLANVLARRSVYDAAEEQLRAAERLDPGSPDMHRGWMMLHARRAEPGLARRRAAAARAVETAAARFGRRATGLGRQLFRWSEACAKVRARAPDAWTSLAAVESQVPVAAAQLARASLLESTGQGGAARLLAARSARALPLARLIRRPTPTHALAETTPERGGGRLRIRFFRWSLPGWFP